MDLTRDSWPCLTAATRTAAVKQAKKYKARMAQSTSASVIALLCSGGYETGSSEGRLSSGSFTPVRVQSAYRFMGQYRESPFTSGVSNPAKFVLNIEMF